MSFLESTTCTKKPLGVPEWKTIRWLEFIAQFDFSIELHAGTANCMKTPYFLPWQFETEMEAPKIIQLSEVIAKKQFWVKHFLTESSVVTAQSQYTDLKELTREWKTFKRNRWSIITQNTVINLTKQIKEKMDTAPI